MSTHNIGFYEEVGKIVFEILSNIIKCALYLLFRFHCNFEFMIKLFKQELLYERKKFVLHITVMLMVANLI